MGMIDDIKKRLEAAMKPYPVIQKEIDVLPYMQAQLELNNHAKDDIHYLLSENERLTAERDDLIKLCENCVHYTEEYKNIIREINNWPDYKKESYNANFATSAHAKKLNDEVCKKCDYALAVQEKEQLWVELYALKSDIEAGFLLKVPCNVGDCVFVVVEDYFECRTCKHSAHKIGYIGCNSEQKRCLLKVEQHSVECLFVGNNGVLEPGMFDRMGGMRSFDSVDGKWYRTRDEAEAARAAMEKKEYDA